LLSVKTISVLGQQVRESESVSHKKLLYRSQKRQPHSIHRRILEVCRHWNFTIESWTVGFLTPLLTIIDE
jgi:hypothetical protein